MEKMIFSFISLFVLMQVHAQNIPGGIAHPAFWLVADSGRAAMHHIPGSAAPGVFSYSGDIRAASFNGHPSIQYNNGLVSYSAPGVDPNRFSLFSVQHPFNTNQENLIWSIQHNDTADMVLTTKRAADLSELQYLNFQDLVPGQPKIDVFIRQGSKISNAANPFKLNLGKKPIFPQLPVANFSGLIPEVICYDRILNTKERNQVSSYLAIKYGITLSEPGGTYLNRNGDIIWNGSLYPEFHHNIAGVGRDDSASLFQIRSGSQNTPGLLTITSNTPLSDNDYFIWGDNDLLLSAEPVKTPGLPFMIQRQGIMINSTAGNTFRANLWLDTKQLDVVKSPETVYWMAVDSSGSGNFAGPDSYFKKMTSLSQQGIANFENAQFGFNAEKKAAFSWTVGTNILMTADVSQPACGANTGSMHIKAWGANFPCQLVVKKNATDMLSATIHDMDGLAINNISAGYYSFKLIDADKNVYSDSFYVGNKNISWVSPLLQQYYLNRPVLELDATIAGGGQTYRWIGPGGFNATGAKVSITEAGLYTHSIEMNGCLSYHQFRVIAPPKNIFTNIEVNPNPSPGSVNVSISLDKPAAVSVELLAEDGRLISVKKLDKMANYFYVDQIQMPGIYFMTFRSGLDKRTKKIIIIR